MSGNLGDTLSVMPVLSGIYKSTGHKTFLVVRDNMQKFNELKKFLEYQDCIARVHLQSEVMVDSSYTIVSLVNHFTKHETRPWETVRLEEYVRQNYNLDFEVDDNFTFKVPPNVTKSDDRYFLVGDRMFHPEMDQRRAFNVLRDSGKFPLHRCSFLDYNKPIVEIASIIKNTKKPIFTTFTGISTLVDLLNKEAVIIWGDDLKDWDNKPIDYSFNKHFYRDRKCKLMYLGDFDIRQFEELYNEI